MKKEELEIKTIEELEDIFETHVSKYDSDFTKIIQILIAKYEEKEALEKVNQLRIELFISFIPKGNSTDNRFPTLKDETVSTYLDDSKVEYIKKRIETTKSLILKAKYCDIIYELNKQECEIGKSAVHSYIEVSEIYFDQNLDFEFVDSIKRALSLSLFLKKKELIDLSYKAHVDKIKTLLDQARYNGFKKVIISLVRNEKKLKDYNLDYELFEKYIEEIIAREKSPSQSTYSLHRVFLNLLLLFPPIKKDLVKSMTIRSRIGKAFEQEGDYVGQTRSQMVAAHIYEDSLQVHISIGSDKLVIESLKKKIRESNKKASKEYGKVPIGFSVHADIDKNIGKYRDKTEIEIFDILSLDPDMIPDYKLILEKMSELYPYPLMIFNKFIMRGTIKFKSISNVDEMIENDVFMKLFMISEFLSSDLLDKVFETVKLKYPSYTTGLIRKISSSDLIKENRHELLKHGILLYSNEDYVSSMHILVFQIEGILRDILYQIDGEDFQYKNNEMRELTMGTIIKKLIEKEILDLNLLKYIETNLCDIRGKNIRNELAHGSFNNHLFTRLNTQILLLILLKISSYKVKK
ncbi:MAG: DUF4209 domain-containing protein [Saprospiraceae bacterium]